MARIVKSNITGALGNLIFYESKGQLLVRTKARKVRQTKATKETAKSFGLAAGCSRMIRAYLSPITKTHEDRSLMYRMNTALLHWLNASKDDSALRQKNIQDLKGFQLNEQAQMNRRLALDIPVDFSQPGKVVVSMPAFTPLTDIKAPERIWKIELMLIAVRCNTVDVQSSTLCPSSSKTIELKYRTDTYSGEEIELPMETIPNDIVMVAIGINFWKSDRRNELLEMDVKWVNGKIIGVNYVA